LIFGRILSQFGVVQYPTGLLSPLPALRDGEREFFHFGAGVKLRLFVLAKVLPCPRQVRSLFETFNTHMLYHP
jgi:hypothetical protein